MEFKIIEPDDPWAVAIPMVKFMFTTDNEIISFIVEDNLSLQQLDDCLGDCLNKDEIMAIVQQYFAEDQIGETKLSKITRVAKIKRLLPSED